MDKNSRDSLVKIILSVLLTALIMRFYVQNQMNQKMRAFDWVDVVAAAHEIPAATILKANDLATLHVARRFVQPGAYYEKISNQNTPSLVGKKTLIVLPADSQITHYMVADATLQDLEKTIPIGKRAYALYLPRSETLRLIHAGSHVDILANLVKRSASGSDEVQAKAVLQDILVLNVRDELLHQPPATPASASMNESFTLLTLAVTPAEAELLSATEKASQGDFRILIRSPYDSSSYPHAKTPSSH